MYKQKIRITEKIFFVVVGGGGRENGGPPSQNGIIADA